MTAVLAGLVLGLAGSAHCAVMCGPLTLGFRRWTAAAGTAVGGRGGHRDRLRPLALYHAGRLAAYAAAGAVAGLVGAQAGAHGIGRGLAVAAGLGLLLAAASFAGGTRGRGTWPARRLAPIFARLAGAAATLTRRRPIAGALAAGAVNACLPCGLLYAALPAAAALGGVGPASMFMLLFGFGTLPALAAVWLVAGAAVPAVGRHLRLATPLALALLGLLILARALPTAHPGHPPDVRPTHAGHTPG